MAKYTDEVDVGSLFATQALCTDTLEYGKDVATLPWHSTNFHPCGLVPGALCTVRAFWLRPNLRPLALLTKYADEVGAGLLFATQALCTDTLDYGKDVAKLPLHSVVRVIHVI